MTRKYINEHYFDEESRAMYYVLGALYSGNVLLELRQGLRFISSHKDLVEIVRRELESEHTIVSDPRGKDSHKLEMGGVPHMYSRLEALGLAVPKNQRGFPDIKEEYLAHFIRGFLDAKSSVNQVKGTQLTKVEIYFNHPFLLDLHQRLQEYADITRDKPFGTKMILGHSDSVKVYHFIYGEWDFIRENGLYLPSKKDSYTPDYKIDPSSFSVAQERKERIERAKELLLEGEVPFNFYIDVDYSHLSSLYRAFKQETGLTTREWLAAQKAELYKETGLSLKEWLAAQRERIYKTFREEMGISPEEWLAAQRAEGWKEIDFYQKDKN